MSLTSFTAEEREALGEARVWPRFLLFPVLAVAGHAAMIAAWSDLAWWAKAAASVAVGYCWFCVAGSFHETVHQTLGVSRRANSWYGRAIGTFLAIPYSAYRETHIRHHAYLNTPQDWELWPYSSPICSKAFRRAFVWFDLLAGVVAAPIVYSRVYWVRHSPLSAPVRRAIRNEYFAIVAFWGLAAGGVAALALTGTIEARQILLWAAPLALAAGFNTLRKFTEHLGMASYDPLLGTRTVVGDNPITRVCSYFNFEIFVHGPHHRYPKAPHNRLADHMARHQAAHPGAAVPLFSSYSAALRDMLPCLWRNPAVGVNAGGGTDYRHTPGIENFVSDVEREILSRSAGT